jgi:methylmalonyl-CoA epimerase
MKIKRVEHVAIAVQDMQGAMAMLENIFGLKLDYVEDRGTSRLAMYPVGETSLELLQAIGPNSRITQWIKNRGQGLWHLCFEVEDIDAALVELREKGVKLLDEVPREGHGGCRIAFIDPASTGDMLIELAELPLAHHDATSEGGMNFDHR